MSLEMYDEYSPFDWDIWSKLKDKLPIRDEAKQFADDVEKWVNGRMK